MDTPDLTTTKRCRTCGEVKLITQFRRAKSNADGFYNACKTCNREYNRKYYQAHSDHIRETSRKYRKENAEHITERKREYRQKNAAHITEHKSKYAKENAERISRYQREYRKTPGYSERARESNHKYMQSEAGKVRRRANLHRYRARKLEAGGNYTASEIESIRAAQTDNRGQLICWRCGKPIKGTPDLDHWIPLKHGGRNDAGNLHYMHVKCNRSKGAKHPVEIGRLL